MGKLRRRRDELIAFLGIRVRSLRKTLEGLFGTGSARVLSGIEGRAEREPVALLAQVERILDRFSDPELELATPGFSTQLPPVGVVADFQPGYKELNNLVKELTREDRRSDATLIAKNEAMSYYDQQFRWIAGCLAMLYHLASLHELAERIKPSTRRPGRTQANVEAEQAERSAKQTERSSETPEVSDEEPETVESEAAS